MQSKKPTRRHPKRKRRPLRRMVRRTSLANPEERRRFPEEARSRWRPKRYSTQRRQIPEVTMLLRMKPCWQVRQMHRPLPVTVRRMICRYWKTVRQRFQRMEKSMRRFQICLYLRRRAEPSCHWSLRKRRSRRFWQRKKPLRQQMSPAKKSPISFRIRISSILSVCRSRPQ